MHEVLVLVGLDLGLRRGVFVPLVYANLVVSHKLFRDSSARQKRDPQQSQTHYNSTDVVHRVSALASSTSHISYFFLLNKYCQTG